MEVSPPHSLSHSVEYTEQSATPVSLNLSLSFGAKLEDDTTASDSSSFSGPLSSSVIHSTSLSFHSPYTGSTSIQSTPQNSYSATPTLSARIYTDSPTINTITTTIFTPTATPTIQITSLGSPTSISAKFYTPTATPNTITSSIFTPTTPLTNTQKSSISFSQSEAFNDTTYTPTATPNTITTSIFTPTATPLTPKSFLEKNRGNTSPITYSTSYSYSIGTQTDADTPTSETKRTATYGTTSENSSPETSTSYYSPSTSNTQTTTYSHTNTQTQPTYTSSSTSSTPSSSPSPSLAKDSVLAKIPIEDIISYSTPSKRPIPSIDPPPKVHFAPTEEHNSIQTENHPPLPRKESKVDIHIDQQTLLNPKSRSSMIPQFICLTFSFLIFGVASTMLGTTLPFIQRAYRISEEDLGTLLLLFNFGLATGNIFALLLFHTSVAISQKKTFLERPPVSQRNLLSQQSLEEPHFYPFPHPYPHALPHPYLNSHQQSHLPVPQNDLNSNDNSQTTSVNLKSFVSEMDINQFLLTFSLLCIGAFFLVIGILPLSLGFNTFFALHFGLGCTLGILEIACNCIASEWDHKTSLVALNFLHVGFGGGAVLTPYFLEFIDKKFSVREGYLILGILTLSCLTAYCSYFTVWKCVSVHAGSKKEHPPSQQTEMSTLSLSVRSRSPPEIISPNINNSLDSPSVISGNPSKESHNIFSRIVFSIVDAHAKLMSKPGYWCMLFATLFYYGGEMVIGEWVSLLLIENGYEEVASLGTTLFWAGIFIGSFLLSTFFLHHAFKEKDSSEGAHIELSQKKARISLPLQVLMGSAISSLAGSMVFTLIEARNITLGLVGVVGIVFSGTHPLIIAVTTATYPSHTGSTMDSMVGIHVFANIGTGLFPLGTGFLADQYGIKKGMWLGVACMGFEVLMVLFFVLERLLVHRKEKTGR